jgi:glycopeptide antibiotics resistance protein
VWWAYGVTDRFVDLDEAQANVLLFVPAGFLLAVVLLSPPFAVVAGVLGSMAIEWVQEAYLPDRVADVHDVVHNGLGAVLGAIAAVPLVWLLTHGRRRTSSTRDARGAVVS